MSVKSGLAPTITPMVPKQAGPKRLIGPHLQLKTGLLKAAARAQAIGATAVQVFTDNPTAWRRKSAPPAKLKLFRERLAAAGIETIAVHAPYLVNLSGAKEDFWHKSVTTMANELVVGASYGARFVVMHVGSHRGLDRAEGIARLAEGLRAVLESADETTANHALDEGDRLPVLVLENAAGTGDGIGASFEDLADIVEAARRAGVASDRLAICLDTAHLWGAGYDIGDAAAVGAVVAQIDELLGRDRVAMLHLNDSRAGLGSRRDRHEHIGAGQLGPEGIHGVLSQPWLATLPTFLETPGMDLGYDRTNLERALRLAAGELVEDLPPEAFGMRRSRRRGGAAKS